MLHNLQKSSISLIIAGDVINLAVQLYRRNFISWWKWLLKRPRSLKPPLQSNLLASTLTYHLCQQLIGQEQDWEGSYAHILLLKSKIRHLHRFLGLTVLGIFIGFYLFTGILAVLSALVIITLAQQSIWLAIGVFVLSIIIFMKGGSIFISSLADISLADISLTQNPDLTPWEAITNSRQLGSKSNLWLSGFLNFLIVSNILGWLIICLQIVLARFEMPLLVKIIPLIAISVVVFSPFQAALTASRYFILIKQREGFDIQLRQVSKSTMQFFKKVTLSTPESVELEFNLAGIGNRTLALLIDYLILAAVLILLLFVWISVANQLDDNVLISQWFNALMLLLYFVIYVGYFVYFETLWQGQTPGKRFAKIRVMQENGRPIGLQHSTLRALLRPFDDPFSLGVLLIIFTKREKRLGDLIANTIVIQEGKRITPVTLQISNRGQEVCNFLLAEAKMTLLTPDDFAVIKDYLQRRQGMNSRARSTVSLRLATELKEYLELEEVAGDVYPELFLEGIYLAYQETKNW